MISDDDLHRLAIFLGSCAMILIILYHFLEVNAKDDDSETSASTINKAAGVSGGSSGAGAATAGGSSIGDDSIKYIPPRG
ncbi:hypothetical protein P168DRAFT_315343 [Aspergillus campestris IBT 28561]|uniref:Dolichyl-diphosphooligosaccharide--protein glycosyltransferase subunit 4 n=1 Tax=Aspergillus campestris (strain IBT 28561) TaxID=1392248 RepID=A0A2I1DHI5_ASPC2|nr:uncharacterized protein P168DRAFT_315343 [Aspergillus campestris IBT 28561]PKY09333.1 hypothetical protein P168DRAFT_315343 [Aspergillus campestris IBT 28561]